MELVQRVLCSLQAVPVCMERSSPGVFLWPPWHQALSRDTPGPAPASYSLTKQSGLFGKSLVKALPGKPPRAPSSGRSELGGAASPVSSEETLGHRARGWQQLQPSLLWEPRAH